MKLLFTQCRELNEAINSADNPALAAGDVWRYRAKQSSVYLAG